MRVAVTGARGRLGRALLVALGEAPGPMEAIPWSRPEYDLDVPATAAALLERDRPDLVVHAAAWTDVDGCARSPELALARNGEAVEHLAQACASRGVGLVLVSTNEVFDGGRTDGRGYATDDRPNPPNPYGASKLAGELAALRAYGLDVPWREEPVAGTRSLAGAPGAGLAVVRTAWLFGPPGNDFPSKIVAAAQGVRTEGRPLRVVADEVGCPTYTVDLARSIVALVRLVGVVRTGPAAAAEEVGRGAVRGAARTPPHQAADGATRTAGPIWHLVNAGRVSRADWARATLALVGLDVPVIDIPASEWARPSTPPRWAVLEPGELPPPLVMRPWREALADYLTGTKGS